MVTTLNLLDSLKLKLKQFRPIDDDLWATIQEKLRIDWTYNSNAIEGNTLTYGETDFFLREGLTSAGKPLKDYLEAKNHAEAIDLLYDFTNSKRKLSESLIKELHALLLKDVEFTYAKGRDGQMVKKPLSPGKYKTRPNHVLTISGKVHRYTSPIHVKDEMENLIKWFNKEKKMHVVEKAAVFHHRFVAIHPFDDGNGRLARLLMNLILIKADYPPCVIKNEHRKQYLECLEIADLKKDLNPFSLFVVSELIATIEHILDILEGKKTTIFKEKIILNSLQRETLILHALSKEYRSISQILDLLPQIKRPTLKKDFMSLVEQKKIRKRGKGKGVVYFKN